jgi:hypothetical protein
MRSRELAVDMGYSSEREKSRRQHAGQATSVREEAASHLRDIFGQAILVMSGQRRMMYQNITPKPEGTIFFKRSKPQGTDRAPHDATTIVTCGRI